MKLCIQPPGVIILIAGAYPDDSAKVSQKLGFLVLMIIFDIHPILVNARNWARYWDDQRETWWQLTWRAPVKTTLWWPYHR